MEGLPPASGDLLRKMAGETAWRSVAAGHRLRRLEKQLAASVGRQLSGDALGWLKVAYMMDWSPSAAGRKLLDLLGIRLKMEDMADWYPGAEGRKLLTFVGRRLKVTDMTDWPPAMAGRQLQGGTGGRIQEEDIPAWPPAAAGRQMLSMKGDRPLTAAHWKML